MSSVLLKMQRVKYNASILEKGGLMKEMWFSRLMAEDIRKDFLELNLYEIEEDTNLDVTAIF